LREHSQGGGGGGGGVGGGWGGEGGVFFGWGGGWLGVWGVVLGGWVCGLGLFGGVVKLWGPGRKGSSVVDSQRLDGFQKIKKSLGLPRANVRQSRRLSQRRRKIQRT